MARSAGTAPLTIYLAPVLGTLSGRAGGCRMVSLSLGTERKFALPIGLIESDMAATATRAAFASSVDVEPADTHFARLGAFAADFQNWDMSGRSGFMSGDTGRPLVLVYVDRPSSMRGGLNHRTLKLDLTFEHAGLYWLQYDPRPSSRVKDLRIVEQPKFLVYGVAEWRSARQ